MIQQMKGEYELTGYPRMQISSTIHGERNNFVEVIKHNDIMKYQRELQNKITLSNLTLSFVPQPNLPGFMHERKHHPHARVIQQRFVVLNEEMIELKVDLRYIDRDAVHIGCNFVH